MKTYTHSTGERPLPVKADMHGFLRNSQIKLSDWQNFDLVLR